MIRIFSKRLREHIEHGDFMDAALVVFMMAGGLTLLILVAGFFVNAWFCTCPPSP